MPKTEIIRTYDDDGLDDPLLFTPGDHDDNTYGTMVDDATNSYYYSYSYYYYDWR